MVEYAIRMPIKSSGRYAAGGNGKPLYDFTLVINSNFSVFAWLRGI